MDSIKRFEPEPTSAPGDFYVENHCCVTCGVPQVVAPDLVGWVDGDASHCYWKKQPTTADEMQRAFAIFDGQELSCHRYAGLDPDIQARVGLEQCDFPAQQAEEALVGDSTPRFQLLANDGFFHRLWLKITSGK